MFILSGQLFSQAKAASCGNGRRVHDLDEHAGCQGAYRVCSRSGGIMQSVANGALNAHEKLLIDQR